MANEMDCEYPPLVAASFAAALLAELAGAALGFGPAILYEIFWQLCFLLGVCNGSLETAVFNFVCQESLCSVLQLFLLREHFDLRLTVLLNVPVLTTLPLGTLVLDRFGSSVWVKRLLGALFICIAGLQGLSKLKGTSSCNEGDPKPQQNIQERGIIVTGSIIAAAAGSGFLRGMFGVAGPPIMVLLLFFSTDRAVWRCTATATRVVMVLAQAILLGGFHQDLQPQCWLMYAALMSGGVAGLLIGNTLAPLVDQAVFHHWLILFLLAGGLLMLSDGSPSSSRVGAICAGAAAFAAACVPVASAAKQRFVQWRMDDLVATTNTHESDSGWTPIVSSSGAEHEFSRDRILSHIEDDDT